MAHKNSKKRFKNGRIKKGLDISFSIRNKEFFQVTSAEREEDLDSYYVDNDYYQSAISPDSKKSFFVGRTGVGKTAILEKVRRGTTPKRNIISIDPEDFAFKIMERNWILDKLTDLKINLDLFYKTMWKYIFTTEILKEIYGRKEKNWFQEQILKWSSDPVAVRAYKFLQKNNELDSGLSFNEKIEKIINKLQQSVEAKVDLGVINVCYKATLSKDITKKIYDAISEFEFTDINYFMKHLDENVLNKYRFIILVDDLDKNWIQNKIGINFTRCLFETIFDINNSKHLRLLVSLRTNLFNQLELGQREKFNPYIEHLFWHSEKIKAIIEKRFKAIGIENKSDVWNFIFPKEVTVDNQRKFKTFDYLLSRSNMRPRDILLFISYAIGNSIGKNRITMDAIIKAEESYSKDRLNALEDEWRNPYLDIGKIFNFFRYCSYKLKKDEFISIVENITMDVLEKEEAKVLDKWSWIIEGGYIDRESWDYNKLINLLYRVGFIGIKETPSSSVQYIHNELNDMPPLNEKTRFYVNPCYYRAINVTFH